MKNIKIVYTTLLLLLAGSIFAQSDSSKAELSVPNYPALNIIGSQTTEITKPGDYSGLEATIISPLVANDGTIPSDLAVEFQPYFFNSNRRTLSDYIEMNEKTDLLGLIWRNSKFSIASNEFIASDSSQYSRIGIGYRTLLKEGKFTDYYTKNDKSDQIQGIELMIDGIRHIDSLIRNDLNDNNLKIDEALVNRHYDKEWEKYSEILKIVTHPFKTNEEKINELMSMQDSIDNNQPWVNPSIYDYSMRKGLFIEFAFAASFDFKDRNITNASEFQRWSAWFNFTYKLPDKGKPFYLNNFSLLTRLSNYSLDPIVVFDKTGTFFDGGLNFQLGLSKRIDLTGEYLLRYALNDFSTQIGEDVTDVTSGTIESKLSASLVLHISNNVSTTFSYSLINGEQSYTPENIQILVLGLTAAILPLK